MLTAILAMSNPLGGSACDVWSVNSGAEYGGAAPGVRPRHTEASTQSPRPLWREPATGPMRLYEPTEA
jgi:hypothetical protein